MNTSSPTAVVAGQVPSRPRLDGRPGPLAAVLFLGLLAIGLAFTAYSLLRDVAEAGEAPTTWVPFVLLGVALPIALGFEFVNGFHDTASPR